jgi:hypothetical protein
MFRTELERQGASLGIMSVFHSMCSYLGGESRDLNRALADLAVEQKARRKATMDLPKELFQKAGELDEIKAGNHPDWALRSTEDLRDIHLLESQLAEAQQLRDEIWNVVKERGEEKRKAELELSELREAATEEIRKRDLWLEEAQQTIARMRKALEFYANEENYCRSDLEREQGYAQEVMWDRGIIAQAALKSTKEDIQQ